MFALLELGAPQHWLDRLLEAVCSQFHPFSFFGQIYNVRALLAVIMVCLICSAVGSLVLSNRMAFFSDALAHCAFAGVTLGFLIFIMVGPGGNFWAWTTAIMIAFGILVGLGIVWVRQKTGQASDTVIGVFFAGAIGFAALLRNLIGARKLFNLEDFLFGSPLLVTSPELIHLFVLTVATAVLLGLMYNTLIFTSFNESLALSRYKRIRIRLCNYVFIMLLAVLVNICLKTVGALLINALLIVPAATARNGARNLRQLFWYSILLCLLVGILGVWLSADIKIPDEHSGRDIQFGMGGAIVVLSVLLFAVSMIVGPWLRDRKRARKPATT